MGPTPDPELFARHHAFRWATRRANRSGRTAKQFVDDFAGRRALGREEA